MSSKNKTNLIKTISRLKEFQWNCGIAGRITPTSMLEGWEILSFNHPRFGFYWWFWFPSMHVNGGRLSHDNECVDINFNWLCFWMSVTFWPTSLKVDKNQIKMEVEDKVDKNQIKMEVEDKISK
jgi:hypothetical protein